MNDIEHFLSWSVSALVALASWTPVSVQHLVTMRAICLPNRPLAVVVALQRGLFTKYGVDVQAEVAPNSESLRADLATGKYEIAHAAVDNAVAMAEDSGTDVVIVMGGEGSTNELIAQPGIRSISELRHRTLIVDAPNTAYALQLKKILSMNGLRPGLDYEIKPVGSTPQRLAAMRVHKEYAASILGPPTSLVAKREGFISLATTQETIGAYQGIGAFVRRAETRDYGEALTHYLAAYVEAQRWILNPVNKPQVIELLIKELSLSHDVAEQTYAVEIAGHGGYEPDARFDMQGFRNVLRLRSEVEGQWGGNPPPPERYCDFSFYRRALSELRNLR